MGTFRARALRLFFLVIVSYCLRYFHCYKWCRDCSTQLEVWFRTERVRPQHMMTDMAIMDHACQHVPGSVQCFSLGVNQYLRALSDNLSVDECCLISAQRLHSCAWLNVNRHVITCQFSLDVRGWRARSTRISIPRQVFFIVFSCLLPSITPRIPRNPHPTWVPGTAPNRIVARVLERNALLLFWRSDSSKMLRCLC